MYDIGNCNSFHHFYYNYYYTWNQIKDPHFLVYLFEKQIAKNEKTKKFYLNQLYMIIYFLSSLTISVGNKE